MYTVIHITDTNVQVSTDYFSTEIIFESMFDINYLKLQKQG